MKVSFIAGFGPITPDTVASLTFWRNDLGLPMTEIAPDYWGTDDVEGVKAFAAWPLSDAAQSCFGSGTWADHVPEPQAWLELDVLGPDAVGEAAVELEAAGHQLLKQPTTEPWGQTVARLLSPEGLLVGITFTPWMHPGGQDLGDAG
jgi:catechol 2,3-dioxygenase-like lactoylglutathione lyase family enzyme